MTDITERKRRAAELEARNQTDRAIVAYREIVRAFDDGTAEPVDIPLYNRLGDLLLKTGETSEAVLMWERAVDHYANGGFLNPAIALANKILRHAPGRTPVHLTLGRILVAKGLRAEARQHFVEYAERTRQQGDSAEAFRALQEFADLVPDAHDVRLLLADQLIDANRVEEAIEQLQLAHGRLIRQGRVAEAEGVADRLRALDPAVTFSTARQTRAAAADGLVFLDVGAVNVPRPTGVFDGSIFVEPAPRRSTASESIAQLQRRVESAASTGDRTRLTAAFLDLGDALVRTGAPQRASAVFQRVLDMDPEDPDARQALSALAEPAPPLPAREAVPDAPDGAWGRDRTDRASQRLRVAERPPAADHELGVAFREAGRLDEAIEAFQRALQTSGQRLRTMEALGRCYLATGRAGEARAILERALAEPEATEQSAVGVLLLLGHLALARGAAEDARRYYQRVFAVDDRFRDVVDRLNSLERLTP